MLIPARGRKDRQARGMSGHVKHLGVFSFSSSLKTRGLGMWLARGQKTGLKVQSMPQTHWDVLSLLLDMRSSIFGARKEQMCWLGVSLVSSCFSSCFRHPPPLFSANVDLVSDQCTRHWQAMGLQSPWEHEPPFCVSTIVSTGLRF